MTKKILQRTHAWQDPKLADFRNFLFLLWKHLRLPDPTPLQNDMADTLQRLILANDARAVLMGFRGAAKSWISSGLSLWDLYWWPNDNILVESAAKPRADEFSQFCFRLINEVPALAPLIPSEEQRQRIDGFDVGPAGASHSPSLRAVGITGQRTGARANLLIADDIEVDKNSDTDLLRAKLKKACLENDAIVKPGEGTIIYLGTPHIEQTVYRELEAIGYTLYVWPSEYPDERLLRVHRNRISPTILRAVEADPSLVGHSTEPTRFSDEYLLKQKSRGRSWYALQYLLDTSAADENRYPLKLRDLMVDDLDDKVGPMGLVWTNDPAYRLQGVESPGLDGDYFHRPLHRLGGVAPWQGSLLTVDPAGRGGDELAVCVTKMLNGNVFLFDCYGLHGGYSDENLITIANTAKRHNVNHCRIESNFGDGMFSQMLRPHMARIHPCGIEDKPSTKRKELRIIEALEPLMNQHRLIVNTRVVYNDAVSRPEDGDDEKFFRLFYQMTRLEKEPDCLRYDDRIDVVGMAGAYWIEQLGIDQQFSMQEAERAATLRELEELARAVGPGAFGPPPGAQDVFSRIERQHDRGYDPRAMLERRALGYKTRRIGNRFVVSSGGNV